MGSKRFAASDWFRHDRFGMFLHWGVYSVAGRGEWVRSHERLSTGEYQQYVDAFVPDDFDAEAWAEAAASAGMTYAVLTAKHHDGFCMYDSAHSSYGVMHNGFGRDVVAEFLGAFRRRGIRVGLYFSLIDWSHPDFPSFGDANHPHRDDEDHRGRDHDVSRYLDFMHAQVRELVTNYGHLDLMWLDFSYEEKSGEWWRAQELVDMIRAHQPGILINNRLEANGGSFGSLVSGDVTPWAGDFVSPEQIIPASGILDASGDPVPWEAAITLNNHWAYVPGDDSHKSSTMVLRKLVEVVSKNGNLLLNVGPQPDGRIAEPDLRILAEVGAWLRRNGASIFGAGRADVPKPEWGYYTRRGGTLFAHVFEPPIGPLALVGVDADSIERLEIGGREVERAQSWLIEAYPETAFVSFGDDDPAFTYDLPDHKNTVVTIRLRGAETASS